MIVRSQGFIVIVYAETIEGSPVLATHHAQTIYRLSAPWRHASRRQRGKKLCRRSKRSRTRWTAARLAWLGRSRSPAPLIRLSASEVVRCRGANVKERWPLSIRRSTSVGTSVEGIASTCYTTERLEQSAPYHERPTRRAGQVRVTSIQERAVVNNMRDARGKGARRRSTSCTWRA